jgi:poly(hydroxyalkanoate) depolymerase family esterase
MIRRVAMVLACALLCAPLSGAARATTGSGSFTKYHYGAANDPFGRDYWVYEPSHIANPRVLVVYLHGCTQTAQDAAVGTRWNELAERKGFVVAYPQEDSGKDAQDATVRSVEGSANGTACWNWFRPEDQSRGAGEPKTIAGITQSVIAKDRIDPRRVYIEGASAGANMATIMGATYPDIYAAYGSLVGCTYANCGDPSGAVAFETMGTRARTMPAFVVDGEADELNPFVDSQGVVDEWLGVADLADDGQMNDSVSRQPASVDNHGLGASLIDGLGQPGDTCVRNMEFPCLGGVLGFEGSYPYSVFTYDAHGRSIVQFFLIHGLGHDYPDGDPKGSFTDPLGPDITSAAYAFFVSHHR